MSRVMFPHSPPPCRTMTAQLRTIQRVGNCPFGTVHSWHVFHGNFIPATCGSVIGRNVEKRLLARYKKFKKTFLSFLSTQPQAIRPRCSPHSQDTALEAAHFRHCYALSRGLIITTLGRVAVAYWRDENKNIQTVKSCEKALRSTKMGFV